MLFAGSYDFNQTEGVFYLNSPLTAEQEARLSTEIQRVGDYYEAHLGIPYGHELSLIQAVATTRRKRWKFNTYPSLVSVSDNTVTLANMFQGEGYSRGIRPGPLSSFYHEAGHYYFGTVFQPRGPLYWVFLEGFNEYLALLATRDLLAADGQYDRSLGYYLKRTSESTYTPLAQITQSSQIGGSYRYSLVPLILSAIEQEVGTDPMWRWMQTLLATPPGTTTDYAFLLQSMRDAGFTEEQMADLESRYFQAEDARQACIETLGLEEPPAG